MLLENNYYGYFQELKEIDYFSAILQYIGTVTKVRANALRILNSTYAVRIFCEISLKCVEKRTNSTCRIVVF